MGITGTQEIVLIVVAIIMMAGNLTVLKNILNAIAGDKCAKKPVLQPQRVTNRRLIK